MWPVGLWQIGQAPAAPLWSLVRSRGSESRALLHLQDCSPAGRPGDGADRASAKPTGHPDVIRRHQMPFFFLLTGTSFPSILRETRGTIQTRTSCVTLGISTPPQEA